MIPVRPRRVSAIVLRQAFLLRGSPARVPPLFAWVAIDVVLWGFITKYLNAISGSRLVFVPMLLGAVLLWDFFARVMQGVTMTFFEDVWSRNFLNVFATPLTIAEYLCGLVLSGVATSTIGLAVMLLLATAVFGLSAAAYGLVLVPALLVLFLFGIALGVAGAALVLRLGPAAEWFIWPIPAVLSPFAGVFYPLATLPPWMRALSWALPPSHVFEALRALFAGAPVPWASLGGAALLALGDVVLAGWIFARVHRHAVRTGLIARYSAESVS